MGKSNTFDTYIIYILLMLIPLIFLFSIRLMIKFICKKRGIQLPFGIRIIDVIGRIKGTKILYVVVIVGIIFIIISFVLVIQNKLLYYPSYDELAYINLTTGGNNMLEEISISTGTETYHGFPSDQYAQNVTASVLIIASQDDEIIPYELSNLLKDSFKDKEFVGVEGLYHNEILDDVSVLKIIFESDEERE